MADDASSPSKVTLEVYAELLAHIRFFGHMRTDEVLRRFDVDAVRWASDAAAWNDAIVREVDEEGANTLLLRFHPKYAETLRRLRQEKPTIEAVGTGPSDASAPIEPAAAVVFEEPAPAAEIETPTFLLHSEPPPEAMPSPKPVAVATVLSSGTLPIANQPVGPATPFASAQPDESGFSITLYARLCAELVQSPDRDAVLARHKLDRAKHASLDQHWRAKFRAAPALGAAFQRSYSDHLVDLEEERRGAKPDARARSPEAGKTKALVLADAPVDVGAPAGQKLTLVEHAELSAELALGMDAAAQLARRSMTQADKTAADEHYRRVVAADRSAHLTWQATFDAARERILAARLQRPVRRS
jgi:hypothetical protein